MTIVVKVDGGIGNQMFQYALGRALVDTPAAELYLDLSSFDQRRGDNAARSFGLDFFDLHYQRATPELLAAFAEARRSRWGRLARHFVPSLATHRFFMERGFAFDPTVFDVRDHTYVEGYWQSEKYFIHLANIIRQDFRFPPVTDAVNLPISTRIKRTNAVSVHVRRGDYAHHPATNAFHGLCDAGYYARAMKHMHTRFPDAMFYVFSDDPEWARTDLDPSYRTELVEANDRDHGSLDLCLMSQCRHHIIANSSFSWWGAWLNPDPNKVVVAPKAWFRDSGIDTTDLIPARWERT